MFASAEVREQPLSPGSTIFMLGAVLLVK